MRREFGAARKCGVYVGEEYGVAWKCGVYVREEYGGSAGVARRYEVCGTRIRGGREGHVGEEYGASIIRDQHGSMKYVGQ